MEVITNFEEIRSRLENERNHILEQIRQMEANAQQSQSEGRREGSPFGKREEEATEAAELEKRLATEQKIKGDLAAVDHALDKFEKGTYGLCDVCGKPIDPARLEALPHASVCMDCKAQQTKNAKTK